MGSGQRAAGHALSRGSLEVSQVPDPTERRIALVEALKSKAGSDGADVPLLVPYSLCAASPELTPHLVTTRPIQLSKSIPLKPTTPLLVIHPIRSGRVVVGALIQHHRLSIPFGLRSTTQS